MPAHGVYFCKIDIEGKTYPGIANVGIKPTVTEEKKLLIEAFFSDIPEMHTGKKYGLILKNSGDRSRNLTGSMH